uniref:Uncharacterized protein n=1 Tax=Poecilia formosa TaxID=48698 RepID=A0A096MHX3_POEFO
STMVLFCTSAVYVCVSVMKSQQAKRTNSMAVDQAGKGLLRPVIVVAPTVGDTMWKLQAEAGDMEG